jgi:hypothetical protein
LNGAEDKRGKPNEDYDDREISFHSEPTRRARLPLVRNLAEGDATSPQASGSVFRQSDISCGFAAGACRRANCAYVAPSKR